eukprot:scaffold295116_cov33-Prasinocladus_malaysianus.AAC.2
MFTIFFPQTVHLYTRHCSSNGYHTARLGLPAIGFFAGTPGRPVPGAQRGGACRPPWCNGGKDVLPIRMR